MTTPPLGPEDRLAALLREEAETVVPAGDGLARIQARVARRRKARWYVIPSAAVATGLAAVAVFALAGPDDDSSLRQVAGPSPSTTTSSSTTATATAAPPATPTPSTVPVPGVSPRPSTSSSTTPPGTAAFAPALWPFASQAQVQAWRANPSSMPWAGDGLGVAQHFVSDYLKLTGLRVVQTCVSCDVVDLVNADGTSVGTIGLVREDDGAPRAYSVSGVFPGNGFRLTSPTEGQKVRSGVTVSGTITGVDESISVSLVTQNGRTVASGSTPAGSGQPWSTTLTWTDNDWYTGAVVLKTYSAKDGALNRLIVRRVTRGS